MDVSVILMILIIRYTYSKSVMLHYLLTSTNSDARMPAQEQSKDLKLSQ